MAAPQAHRQAERAELDCLRSGLGLVADREGATQPGLAARAETEESGAEAAAEEEPEPPEAARAGLAARES